MAADSYGEPLKILLVEDNPGDVRLTMEILKESKIYNQVAVKMALTPWPFCVALEPFAQATLPDLILLI